MARTASKCFHASLKFLTRMASLAARMVGSARLASEGLYRPTTAFSIIGAKSGDVGEPIQMITPLRTTNATLVPSRLAAPMKAW